VPPTKPPGKAGGLLTPERTRNDPSSPRQREMPARIPHGHRFNYSASSESGAADYVFLFCAFIPAGQRRGRFGHDFGVPLIAPVPTFRTTLKPPESRTIVKRLRVGRPVFPSEWRIQVRTETARSRSIAVQSDKLPVPSPHRQSRSYCHKVQKSIPDLFFAPLFQWRFSSGRQWSSFLKTPNGSSGQPLAVLPYHSDSREAPRLVGRILQSFTPECVWMVHQSAGRPLSQVS